MRLINFLKFLLLLLCGFDAYANTCVDLAFGVDRDGVATNIASTETIRLNEVEYNNINTILADSLDVKFWVEECVNENQIEYSLISTIRPIEPGKSQGAGVYDLAIIQNNQQFDGVLYFTDNLYVSSDFGAGLYSFYYPENGTFFSVPPDLDLRLPFTLIISCDSTLDNSSNCSAVNQTHQFELSPQPGTDNQSVISSVNGAWYDPNYDGSGFNIAQTTAGFLMYFYGYREGGDGEVLWLASAIGPETIHINESFTLDMYSGYPGNGGSLTTKPDTANSGTSIWGTAEVTFFSCSNGTIVTHNISLLVGIDGVNCQ